jgi:DNA polymerase IV (archaeal DinB-like DNA polymerase)
LDRVIGHIDLDYFYAQVEEVLDPSLKTRPVLVCVFSGRTEDSGVVSTANYIARKHGVRSGMPIVTAKKKLEGTGAALIKMEHRKYEEVSDRIMDALEQKVDVLERAGIDEAFFDVTRRVSGDFGEAESLATSMKKDLFEAERLTSSVGLGRSKVVAKMASDFKKPDGLTVVLPEKTESFLGSMPVIKLYGVGPKTADSLHEKGISTIADLARADVDSLGLGLGRKLAAYLHDAATGLDPGPVTANQGASQLSRMVTLKADTRSPDEASGQLAEAVRDLQGKIAAERLSFRTVSVIGILTDLSSKTRSKTFETPVSDPSVLPEQVRLLMAQLAASVARDFRRVGLRVSDLASAEEQASLSQFYQAE